MYIKINLLITTAQMLMFKTLKFSDAKKSIGNKLLQFTVTFSLKKKLGSR